MGMKTYVELVFCRNFLKVLILLATINFETEN